MEHHLQGFNIRVYALCVINNRLLTLKEPFSGVLVTKFPGGGLEMGEGTVDCLKREFEEELNLKIEVVEPFYIQENFVDSLAKDHKQLLTIYFTATILNIEQLEVLDKNIQQVQWVDITAKNPFTLPVDQLVFNKLQAKLNL